MQQKLTWPVIIAINIIFLIIAGIAFSVQLANSNTEIRSRAATIIPTPTPYSPPNYPSAAAVIDRVTPFFGKPGDAIVIQGAHFGANVWGSSVTVGGVNVPHTDITTWSDSELTVNIPQGAQSGSVWITVNGKQATWNGTLSVTDGTHGAIISLAPNITITNADGAVSGMIEISYNAEAPTFIASPDILVQSQTQGADAEGNYIRIEFSVKNAAALQNLTLGTLSSQNPTSLTLLQAVLYDSSHRPLPIFANP